MLDLSYLPQIALSGVAVGCIYGTGGDSTVSAAAIRAISLIGIVICVGEAATGWEREFREAPIVYVRSIASVTIVVLERPSCSIGQDNALGKGAVCLKFKATEVSFRSDHSGADLYGVINASKSWFAPNRRRGCRQRTCTTGEVSRSGVGVPGRSAKSVDS